MTLFPHREPGSPILPGLRRLLLLLLWLAVFFFATRWTMHELWPRLRARLVEPPVQTFVFVHRAPSGLPECPKYNGGHLLDYSYIWAASIRGPYRLDCRYL